jgi:ribosomal protein L10
MRAAIIQKEKLVQEIQTNLQNSKAIIFYNFHHIDNEKLFALKKDLKKVGGF